MAGQPAQPREDDDFLAFWAEHRSADAPETKRILGVEVEVPTDLPLSFEDRANELQSSQKREDFEELLTALFGEGVLAQWKANGLTASQLRVLVAWGMTNASGKPMTFAEAAAWVDEAEKKKAEAEAEGKAEPTPINRAARRASSRTSASAGTGGRSKRTSRANTG